MSLAIASSLQKTRDNRFDWQWQIKNAIRRIEDLPQEINPNRCGDSSDNITPAFPMVISPYYLSLIDHNDPDDPIRKMAIPSSLESVDSKNLFEDPIKESEHSPIPGVIRRYRDRALLLVSGKCAVNCRHCTRRQIGTKNLKPLAKDGLRRAVEYLAANPEIRDVILSGGDPLLLEDDVLFSIIDAVKKVKSIEIVRIGTRTPVTLPMRITESLAQGLRAFSPIFVNTQFNHPKEITEHAKNAVACLIDRGIPVANQAVLLRGVNDSTQVIEALLRSLYQIRVRPYYLFMCDLWRGLDHFRTSIDKGIEIMEYLRGRISGLAIPELVIDLPGGLGKIPIGPNYIVSRKDNIVVLKSPNGQIIEYPEPIAADTDNNS